jgi:hypothetical protein
VKEELSGAVQDNLIDRTRLLVMRKWRKKEKMKMGELMVKIEEETEELFWEREAFVDFYRQAKGLKEDGTEAGEEEEEVQKGEAAGVGGKNGKDEKNKREEMRRKSVLEALSTIK